MVIRKLHRNKLNIKACNGKSITRYVCTSNIAKIKMHLFWIHRLREHSISVLPTNQYTIHKNQSKPNWKKSITHEYRNKTKAAKITHTFEACQERTPTTFCLAKVSWGQRPPVTLST